MFMTKITNHMDISTKYGVIVLSEITHNYFNLEGEFLHPVETEVITIEKRNLRMDIAYLRSENIINNIENQSGIVDMKKLEIIAEYTKFLLIHNNSLTNSIIVTKVDPKYCQKEINLTKTLILRPYYLYKPPEEILERLNNISYKVYNNQQLTYEDACEWAMLPTLAQDDIAPYVTKKVCELIKKDNTVAEKLKTDICFVVEIMIDRNIRDENAKMELLEMIDMEKRKTAFEYLVDEINKESSIKIQELKENVDVLEKNNKILGNDKKVLEEDIVKLQEENKLINDTLSQIKKYYSDEQSIPKEIYSLLLKI